MKWSVHSEKRKFIREAAGKHKVILKFIEHYLKMSKYRSHSAICNIRGNGKLLFCMLLCPVLEQYLKIPLLYTHLLFPCSTLQFNPETAGL